MKFRILFLIILTVIVCCIHPEVLNAKQDHVYINGTVKSITESTITVDDKDYTLSPDCRVVQHSENKGAFFENSAELTDIEINDSVFIKVAHDIVTEIIIEQWKRGGTQ